MADNVKERIQEMKQRAAEAVHGEFCGIINECQAPVIVDIATRHFVAEIERLERENRELHKELGHQDSYWDDPLRGNFKC